MKAVCVHGAVLTETAAHEWTTADGEWVARWNEHDAAYELAHITLTPTFFGEMCHEFGADEPSRVLDVSCLVADLTAAVRLLRALGHLPPPSPAVFAGIT